MNITDRIRRSIRSRAELVFRPADFLPFGSEASVKRALKELMDIGVLVRLGVGIYAKAKPSVISGKPIPIQPLEVLGPQALTKLGIRLKESFQTAEYNSGRSTQVPTGIVVNIGKQRVSRKIGFNGKFLKYEHA
ncbi:DUF6088 family protein [Limnohabitans sp. JirII-31]|uniref:DUF6088 family protein n=1 Tax=Limnohabitans sp. JirII-31 TaxID=1977908 RepID=UPI000C1F8E97|nr:DUF6088 family protein [Limnohabitans sp. JirII-31]PIT76684.1 S-adenosylhomocysteine hydrolase [Limnohabitans sp. JirII-31]